MAILKRLHHRINLSGRGLIQMVDGCIHVLTMRFLLLALFCSVLVVCEGKAEQKGEAQDIGIWYQVDTQ